MPPSPTGPVAEDMRAEVRAFLAAEQAAGTFTPRCDGWLAGWDEPFSRRLAERGWLVLTLPRRYGGHGRSTLDRFVVTEELLAAGAPVADHWIADRQIGHRFCGSAPRPSASGSCSRSLAASASSPSG
jgi:hypothetical protein